MPRPRRNPNAPSPGVGPNGIQLKAGGIGARINSRSSLHAGTAVHSIAQYRQHRSITSCRTGETGIRSFKISFNRYALTVIDGSWGNNGAVSGLVAMKPVCQSIQDTLGTRRGRGEVIFKLKGINRGAAKPKK